jgi:hypothetical protein
MGHLPVQETEVWNEKKIASQKVDEMEQLLGFPINQISCNVLFSIHQIYLEITSLFLTPHGFKLDQRAMLLSDTTKLQILSYSPQVSKEHK